MTEETSPFDKQLKSITTFLSRWQGADARLWELTRAIQTLRIVVQNSGSSNNLLLSCIDPVFISAPTSWKNNKIVVTTAKLPDDSLGFLVSDPDAGVRVVCGLVEVKENVKLR